MRIRPIVKKTVIGIAVLLMLMAILGLLGRLIAPHQSLREKLEASRRCRLCDLSGVDLSGADLAGTDLTGAFCRRPISKAPIWQAPT